MVYESTLFWIVVAGVAVIALFAINQLLGGLADARAREQDRYRHRTGNELPRVLHTRGGDEVLEMKDTVEMERG